MKSASVARTGIGRLGFLRLDGMDGIDALKAIRAADPTATVLICSSDRQTFRQDEARDAGAVAFLTKPLTRERLSDALFRALAA